MNDNSNRKNLSVVILFIIAGIFLFIIGFFLGRIDLVNRNQAGSVLEGDVKSSYKSVNVNLLWEIWDKIDDVYIEDDIDGQVLLDGMARGLIESLDDPYTQYLNAEETQEYLKANAGEFEGIGTTLRFTGEYTEIETPIDGYPAQQAGLRPGDVIIEVDSEDVVEKQAFETAQMIRGDAGTTVVLKVVRKGSAEPLEFSIVRAKIDIDSVTYELLEGEIAYIEINQFTEENVFAFQAQWDEIVEEALRDDPDKIIIDVRNNPGGYVDGVVHVLAEFFPKGTVVMSERDREGGTKTKKTRRDGQFQVQEVVILVNEGSASSAEIFAGAIQDLDRGEIIGMDTVGKGVEQRIMELSSGGSLHLVFQEWVLPKGRVVNEEDSIHPDIEIDLTEEDFQNRTDPQLDRAVEELS